MVSLMIWLDFRGQLDLCTFLQNITAIDDEHSAVDVACIGRRQKDGCGSDFVRGASASGRRMPSSDLLFLG